jgi:hypothetical protein
MGLAEEVHHLARPDMCVFWLLEVSQSLGEKSDNTLLDFLEYLQVDLLRTKRNVRILRSS